MITAFALSLEHYSGSNTHQRSSRTSAKMDASTPHPLADKVYLRYYIKDCPRQWECTAAVWKKCRHCESYESEHEARSKLLDHLTRSGHHRWNDQWKLQDSADNAEVLTEEAPGVWFDEPPGPEIGELVTSPAAIGELVTSPGFHVAVDRKNYSSGKPPAQNVHPARGSLVHSGLPQIHHHIISGQPHIWIFVCIADNSQRVNRTSWLHSGQPHILAAAFAPTLT